MTYSWISPAREDVLAQHRSEFEITTGSDHKRIIQKIKEALHNTHGTKLPKKLAKESHFTRFYDMWYTCILQTIMLWYKGEQDKDDSTGIPDVTQTWNLLHVVQFKMINEINARIEDKPGSKVYMSQFHRVSGEVCNELPADVRGEYAALANMWNETKPPRELQIKWVPVCMCLPLADHERIPCRQAKKSLAPTTFKFVDELDHQMGVKVVLFVAWAGDGDAVHILL
jgi:hypothetical protein